MNDDDMKEPTAGGFVLNTSLLERLTPTYADFVGVERRGAIVELVFGVTREEQVSGSEAIHVVEPSGRYFLPIEATDRLAMALLRAPE